MGVRRATQADVGAIVHFLHEYHDTESNLSDIAFDRYSMTKCVEYHVGMPKHTALVYEKDKEIKGVLLGSVEPFMFNKKRMWASDTLNIAHEGGAWLTKKFIEWAKMYNNVDRIIMGVSTGIERSDRLYEALGMERTGGMYMLKITEVEN